MTPHQVRALRERLSLTQSQFAELLLVSRATVNRWEREGSRRRPQRTHIQAMERLIVKVGRE